MSHEIIRDPTFYRPSIHFLQMKRERRIDGEVIRRCITEGDATYDTRTDAIKYRATVGGVRYCLVADPHSRDVCTVYAEEAA